MMKKVPKRRFKGFLNAGDWEQRKLEGLCDLFTDGDWIESKDQCGSGVRLIQTGNIGVTEYLDKPDNKKWISDETFNQLHCKEVFPGDILISRLPEPAGRACIIPHLGTKMITAVDCTIVRTSTNTTASFLVQYLSSQPYFNEVNKCLAGGTRQRISRSALAEFKVLVPSEKAEQDIIGKVFDKFDILITIHQRKLEKLQATKKALLYELFPIENSRRPKRRFKGFTGDWEQRKFKDIAFKRGKISEADLPYVEFEDINSGIGTLNKNILQKVGHKKGILFEAGDVLFGKLRPYLQNWLLCQFMGIAVGDFWVFQPQIVSSAFLYYLIQSEAYQSVVNISSGTKMPRSSWSLVSETHFSIPKYKEATMIGEFLTSIDKNITLHQ